MKEMKFEPFILDRIWAITETPAFERDLRRGEIIAISEPPNQVHSVMHKQEQSSEKGLEPDML